ncbi:MAG TPA: hypothetical protein VNQ76_11690 [Planctomicrobium sp.]|nr:hypothetical protein [Planctomicrobium sp.]
MPRNPDDLFDLQGKNLRRVVPQVRKNIGIQRVRVMAHLLTFFVLLAFGVLGSQTTGVFFVFGVGCLVILPFSIIGILADHHLMRWHQRRLAECERRLNESETFG